MLQPPPGNGRFVIPYAVRNTMSASIEDILSSKGEPAPVETTAEPAPEPEPAPEAEPAPAADVSRETPADPEPKPEPKADPPSDVPTQALLEERAKRQAAEYQLSLMQKAPQQQPAPTPAEPESVSFDWDNPQASFEALQRQQEQRLKSMQTAMQSQFSERMVSISEANARARHSDFDAKLAAFQNAVANNPTLLDQAKSHIDPAEFIYQAGKASEELGAVGGDLDAYKARIRAEQRAEIEAEVRAELEAKPNVPEPESAARSASPTKGAEPVVHKPLSEILAR